MLKSFGSIEKLQSRFNTLASTIEGSGWCWLAFNPDSETIEIRVTKNQDRLSDEQKHLVPLYTVDVWEHAYYLDYFNNRLKFIQELWKLTNWTKIEERIPH